MFVCVCGFPPLLVDWLLKTVIYLVLSFCCSVCIAAKIKLDYSPAVNGFLCGEGEDRRLGIGPRDFSYVSIN